MAQDDNRQSEKMSQLALLWGQAKPAVSAYVRAVVRNHHDAEDVIQNIVSRIAQRFDDYDQSKPFVAWALGFARLVVKEHCSNHRRRPILLDDAAMESLSTAIDKESAQINDRYEALEHCISRLSERHRAVLVQRYRQQMSREQIASMIEVKENTISVMLCRIRRALADCVSQRVEGVRG